MMRAKLLLFLLSLVAAACAGTAVEEVDGHTAYERASEPDRRAIERLRYAEMAINSGELNKAQLADAYYYEGESYYYLRNYKSAIASYQEVLRLSPDDAMTYGGIGHAEYMLRHYDDAIRSYETALRLSGDRQWSEAIETTRRERDQEREAASRPPPEQQAGRDTRQVDLIFIGFRAVKLQPDGPFKQTNEVGVRILVDSSEPLAVGDYIHDWAQIKKGTKVVVNRRVWTGPIDATVNIDFELTELEKDEGSKGRAYQVLGQAKHSSVPKSHLTRDPLVEAGLHYHLRFKCTNGGALYFAYFQYRSAR